MLFISQYWVAKEEWHTNVFELFIIRSLFKNQISNCFTTKECLVCKVSGLLSVIKSFVLSAYIISFAPWMFNSWSLIYIMKQKGHQDWALWYTMCNRPLWGLKFALITHIFVYVRYFYKLSPICQVWLKPFIHYASNSIGITFIQ